MNVNLYLESEVGGGETEFTDYVMSGGVENLTYKTEDENGDSYVPTFGVKLSSLDIGLYFNNLRISKVRAAVSGTTIFEGRLQEHGVDIDLDQETTVIRCASEDKRIQERFKNVALKELVLVPDVLNIPSGVAGPNIITVARHFNRLSTVLGAIATAAGFTITMPSLVAQYYIGGVPVAEDAETERVPDMNGYDFLSEVCKLFLLDWWWDGTQIKLARRKDLLPIASGPIDVDAILDTGEVASATVDIVRFNFANQSTFSVGKISRAAGVDARKISVTSKFEATERVFLFAPWNDYSRAVILSNSKSPSYVIRQGETGATYARKVSALDLLQNNYDIELLRTFDWTVKISLMDGPHPSVFKNIYQKVNGPAASVLWVSEATVSFEQETADIRAVGYDLSALPEAPEDGEAPADSTTAVPVVGAVDTVEVSDDFTVPEGVGYILVTTGNTNKTVVIDANEVTVVKADSGTGNVVIEGTVNGQDGFTLAFQFAYVKLRKTGEGEYTIVGQG